MIEATTTQLIENIEVFVTTLGQVEASVVSDPVTIYLGEGGGPGDMTQAVYDPAGVKGDAFDAENLHGVIDGGVFT